MSEISASTPDSPNVFLPPDVYPPVDKKIVGLNERCGGKSIIPIECESRLICVPAQIDPKIPIVDLPGICKPVPGKTYILNFSGLSHTYSSGRINIEYTFGGFVSSPVLVSTQTAAILDQNKSIGSGTLVQVKWKFQNSQLWRTFRFNAICDNAKHSENIWGAVRALPIFFDYKCSDSLLPRPSLPIITLPVIRPVNPVAAV